MVFIKNYGGLVRNYGPYPNNKIQAIPSCIPSMREKNISVTLS